MKYIDMLERVLQIKVSLSPLEIYCLVHMANLFQNLSSTRSQTAIDLKGAPKGRRR